MILFVTMQLLTNQQCQASNPRLLCVNCSSIPLIFWNFVLQPIQLDDKNSNTFIFKADVACFEMGYYGGANYFYSYSYLGPTSFNFSYDYLDCNGTESQLKDCFHAENTTCENYHGVWIYCDTNTYFGDSKFFLMHKVPQALRPLTNQLCFIICELCYFFTVSVPCQILGHVIPSGCLQSFSTNKIESSDFIFQMADGVIGQAGQSAPSHVRAESEQGPGFATSQGHIQKESHVRETVQMKSTATLISVMQQVCCC